MLGPFVFIPLLVAVCFYAWLRGSGDERLVAATCLAGTAATLLVVSPMRQRYVGLEEGLLMVDLAVLAGFVTVALRSKRFWPLWIAGLQLTTSLGHILKGIDQDLLPWLYARTSIWSYPILLVLVVGTFRSDAGCARAGLARWRGPIRVRAVLTPIALPSPSSMRSRSCLTSRMVWCPLPTLRPQLLGSRWSGATCDSPSATRERSTRSWGAEEDLEVIGVGAATAVEPSVARYRSEPCWSDWPTGPLRSPSGCDRLRRQCEP